MALKQNRQIGIEYQLIRSKRRTLGMEVRENGVIVRAPYFVTQEEIDRFLLSHCDWIKKKLSLIEKQKNNIEKADRLSMDDIRLLADRAKDYIPDRVRFYADKVGVTYGQITIRNQKTRWGSCSAKGNLNFNCLLMLTPPEVIDSVVVHELCHRKEMNHSKRFYDEVTKVYPEYKKWNKWLKENGNILMKRMTG